MAQRPHRSAVPVELTWDLESLFPTTAAWESALARVDAMLPDLLRYKGRLGESAGTLLAGLTLRDEIKQAAHKVIWYGHNSLSVDQTDPVRVGLRDRAMGLNARVGAALAFIKPELLALPEGTVESFLAAEPGLHTYTLQLTDILAEKEHMLGAEAEAVLAQMTELMQAPYGIWQAATAGDMKFDPVADARGNTIPMSVSAMVRLLQSPDRSLREAAYLSVRKAYGAQKRTLAAALAAAVKRDATLARLRRYPSSLAAALAPGHLPESLFFNLLSASESGSHHLRRYYEFRRKELGLEKTMPWDLMVPLDADLQTDLTIKDGCQMILEAVKPLGPQYRAILERAYRERWIDWADNEGKEFGAYSSGCYGFHPVIFMNWQGKLSDVFTLAHELGHAAHSILCQEAQPYPYAHYSLFLAEMASTTNELLLARHLLQTTTDRSLRRYVLMRAIGAFTSNFWGGSMSAAFQLKIHQMAEKGEPLTPESLTAVQMEVLKHWYGDVMEITPEGAGSTWSLPPHHFLQFYSYQYATGISAAAAFSDAILREGQPAVDRYLQFLRSGSSAHDIDLLHVAGLDFTTAEPMQKAVAVFAQFVDELERT